MSSLHAHWTGTAFAVLVGGLLFGWLLSRLSPKWGGVVALLGVLVFAYLTFAPAGLLPELQQHLTS